MHSTVQLLRVTADTDVFVPGRLIAWLVPRKTFLIITGALVRILCGVTERRATTGRLTAVDILRVEAVQTRVTGVRELAGIRVGALLTGGI